MDIAVEDIIDRLSDENAEQVASVLLYRKLKNKTSVPRFDEMSDGEKLEKRAEYLMEINKVSKHHPELALKLDFSELEIERLYSVYLKYTNMAKIEETYKKYRAIYEWALRLGEMFLIKCFGMTAIRGFAEMQIASDCFDSTLRDWAETSVVKKKPGSLNVIVTVVINIAMVWICNTWGNGDVAGLKSKIDGFFDGNLNPIELLSMFQTEQKPTGPPPRAKRLG
jgi:hypothetical protein